MRHTARLAAVALTGLALLAPMGSASATDPVTRSGSCSINTTWTLRAAEALGDRADIRLTVNSRRAGDTWQVTLLRNGNQFFSGQRVTNPQGDFTVFRSALEANGVNDVYTARTRNQRSGETCFARVVLPD